MKVSLPSQRPTKKQRPKRCLSCWMNADGALTVRAVEHLRRAGHSCPATLPSARWPLGKWPSGNGAKDVASCSPAPMGRGPCLVSGPCWRLRGRLTKQLIKLLNSCQVPPAREEEIGTCSTIMGILSETPVPARLRGCCSRPPTATRPTEWVGRRCPLGRTFVSLQTSLGPW